MKFAICQELFEGWDWKKQCSFIAEVGYSGIEVAPFTLAPSISDVSASHLAEMKSIATDHGLTIVGLHWLLAKTEGLHLTTSNEGVRQSTASYLRELGRACAALGGEVMVFGSPQQRSLEPGMTRAQAMANAADVFRQVMPALEELGVAICMEPLTAQETDFVNTCADAVELIEMVDSPAFVLHQDVKAMSGAETDSIPTLIDRHRDITAHFHVNDVNLQGPGMGEVDFHPILKALHDCDYDKWVSVEVFDYSPGAETIARKSIEYLQRVLATVAS